MMNTVKEKWPEIIEHLRVEHELSNVSFNTWIQPLKVYDVVDNTVFILVNMNASVEYIEKKYQLPLKVCIAEITAENEALEKHYLDSLTALEYLPQGAKCVDVGTGAGFEMAQNANVGGFCDNRANQLSQISYKMQQLAQEVELLSGG